MTADQTRSAREAAGTGTTDLDGLRRADLDTLAGWFDGGDAPSAGELDGGYRGRLVAVAGVDRIGPLAWGLDLVASSPLMPWRGKRFTTGGSGTRHGANIWLTAHGPDLVGYDCRVQDGSMVLDYDVAGNPPPLRRILGAVRRVAPGLYLGRMTYRLGDGPGPILLYFTLEN